MLMRSAIWPARYLLLAQCLLVDSLAGELMLIKKRQQVRIVLPRLVRLACK